MAPRPSCWRISYFPTRPDSSLEPGMTRVAGSLMETDRSAADSLPAHLARDREVVAPVARPTVLGGLGADGDLLAVGDGLHAIPGNAQGGQVVVRGAPPALAQGQVVLDR